MIDVSWRMRYRSARVLHLMLGFSLISSRSWEAFIWSPVRMLNVAFVRLMELLWLSDSPSFFAA